MLMHSLDQHLLHGIERSANMSAEVKAVESIEDGDVIFIVGSQISTHNAKSDFLLTEDRTEAKHRRVKVCFLTSQMTCGVSATIHQVSDVHRSNRLIDVVSKGDSYAQVVRLLQEVVQQNEQVDYTALKGWRAWIRPTDYVAVQYPFAFEDSRYHKSSVHPRPLLARCSTIVRHSSSPNVVRGAYPTPTGVSA